MSCFRRFNDPSRRRSAGRVRGELFTPCFAVAIGSRQGHLHKLDSAEKPPAENPGQTFGCWLGAG